LTLAGSRRTLQDMTADTPTPTEPRTWQEVAKDRGLNLRELGEMVGRTHSTMLAYSCGKLTPPKKILALLAQGLEEPVR
jgi:hypothetical protein